MTLLKRLALLASFCALLQPASTLTNRTELQNKIQGRAPGPVPFPPKTPLETKLGHVVDGTGDTSALWVTITIDGIGFVVQFDTGSASTWVMSTEMKGPQFDDGHNYQMKQVHNCKPDTIRYGDGTLVSVYDEIGGVTFADCTKPDYKFFAAVGINPAENEAFYAYHGIKGMFGAARAGYDVDPLLEGTRFAVYVEKEDNSKVTNGDLEMNMPITLDLVSSYGIYWVIRTETFGNAMVDTGTSSLQLPDGWIASYLADIEHTPPDEEEETGWMVPCETKLPPIEIHLEDKSQKPLVIPGSRLMMAWEGDEKDGKDQCKLWLKDVEGKFKGAILGLPFFYDRTVTLDDEGNKIGLSN